MEMKEKKLGGKEIYRGRIVNLYVDDVELPDGSRSKREVVRHCLASAILAINDKDEVLLERQYRYPYDEIITEIPAGCFSNCPELTNISFPEGLQAIGQSAFYGCVKLSDLRLPSTLTSIGGYAFHGCSSLTSLILPDGLLTIGEYAFYSTDMLYVFIPESVANIGSGAFSSRYLFCEAASKPEGWALFFYYGDAYTRYGTPHFDEFLFVDDVDILYGIRTNEEGLLEAEILAKLEYFNPTGSVKDRLALAMVVQDVCFRHGQRNVM